MNAVEKRLRIDDLPRDRKPRERLLTNGVEVLSDAELLAILLGTGTDKLNAIELGDALLTELGGFSGIHREDVTRLTEIRGIGPAKAAAIKAAVEVGHRLAKEKPDLDHIIKTPEDIVELVGYEMRGKDHEELWVLWLNARNRLLGRERLYRGSQDSSSVRVSEIFTKAVRKGAYSLVIVHNHPSGDPSESPEDVNLTRAVVEAGKLLDVRVLDHIIIGSGSYTSIKRNHPSLWV